MDAKKDFSDYVLNLDNKEIIFKNFQPLLADLFKKLLEH